MVDVIDHSPPRGDYVRYIEELMALAAQNAPRVPEPLAPGWDQKPAVVDKRRAIRRRLAANNAFGKKSSGQGSVLDRLLGGRGTAPAGIWVWIAIAIVMAGVLFPVALLPLAIVAYVVWRALAAAVKQEKGNRN